MVSCEAFFNVKKKRPMFADYPAFDIDLVTDNIVSGRLSLETAEKIDSIIAEEVIQAEKFSIACIGDSEDDEDGDDLNLEIRKGKLHWLTKSQEATDLVDKLVEEINVGYFNLNISDLATEYQFTIYDEVTDHYDWHQDYYDDDSTDFVRELSISVCLSCSEMYDGAELFIKDGSNANIRIFKMKFGDFVIFPSKCEHRVNMLREGTRYSLVIWYGHYTKTSDA